MRLPLRYIRFNLDLPDDIFKINTDMDKNVSQLLTLRLVNLSQVKTIIKRVWENEE